MPQEKDVNESSKNRKPEEVVLDFGPPTPEQRQRIRRARLLRMVDEELARKQNPPTPKT